MVQQIDSHGQMCCRSMPAFVSLQTAGIKVLTTLDVLKSHRTLGEYIPANHMDVRICIST